jgi:hypothetical protein
MKITAINSAFPTGDHNNAQPEYGMSIRDYYVGQAMIGLLATNQYSLGEIKQGSCVDYIEAAVIIADEIIIQLNKIES